MKTCSKSIAERYEHLALSKAVHGSPLMVHYWSTRGTRGAPFSAQKHFMIFMIHRSMPRGEEGGSRFPPWPYTDHIIEEHHKRLYAWRGCMSFSLWLVTKMFMLVNGVCGDHVMMPSRTLEWGMGGCWYGNDGSDGAILLTPRKTRLAILNRALRLPLPSPSSPSSSPRLPAHRTRC